MRKALALLAILLPLAQARALEGGAESVQFHSHALYIDVGDEPLAAWQLELSLLSPGALLLGVEGGDAPAFAEPAYYDPAALRGGRIVLAAFSLDDMLPTGRTRVGTVHVQQPGDVLEFRLRLLAAAGSDGQRIDARLTLESHEEND